MPELVERVQSQRETAVILKAGLPAVRVVPVPAADEVPEDLIAFLRRWRTEYPEADKQFAEAMEETRHAVQSARNPWD